MNHLQLAFIIGFLGSFHCVGMCGPLAFALQSNFKSYKMLLQKLSYNIGRTVSYTFLGILMGYIGKQIWIAGWQQWLSILSGMLIVLVTLPKFIPQIHLVFPLTIRFQQKYNRIISKAIENKSAHFLIGILNGFLPCGFVYLALATSLNTNSVLQSGLFMFFFGLGTLPLMLIAMIGINLARPPFRRRINQVLPLLTIFLGCWFILRGMNLGIPYLSPTLKQNKVICH